MFLRDGDSKYVAEKIAGALGDEARSIQECDGHLLGIDEKRAAAEANACWRRFVEKNA